MKHTMLRKTAAALSVCCVLRPGGVMADPFLFDPDGAGGLPAVTVSIIDWAPGNILELGGNPPGAGLTVGSIVQDLFQANLSSMANGAGAPVFSDGTGGNFFTVVASFFERVTSASPFPGVVAFDDTLAPTPSFFRICRQSALGSNLTGAGMACTDANAILTGHLTDIVNANQQIISNSTTLLDGSGNGDNWSGQLTVLSAGAAIFLVQIDTVNNAFFPNLHPGANLASEMSLIAPFSAADPSYCFSSNGTTSSTSGTTVCNNGSFQAFGTLGTVNGLNGGVAGPNFILQADANSSIAGVVPEPPGFALFGIGLLGFVGMRRRVGRQQSAA